MSGLDDDDPQWRIRPHSPINWLYFSIAVVVLVLLMAGFWYLMTLGPPDYDHPVRMSNVRVDVTSTPFELADGSTVVLPGVQVILGRMTNTGAGLHGEDREVELGDISFEAMGPVIEGIAGIPAEEVTWSGNGTLGVDEHLDFTIRLPKTKDTVWTSSKDRVGFNLQVFLAGTISHEVWVDMRVWYGDP